MANFIAFVVFTRLILLLMDLNCYLFRRKVSSRFIDENELFCLMYCDKMACNSTEKNLSCHMFKKQAFLSFDMTFVSIFFKSVCFNVRFVLDRRFSSSCRWKLFYFCSIDWKLEDSCQRWTQGSTENIYSYAGLRLWSMFCPVIGFVTYDLII